MWLKETTREERKTLIAAFAGFGVDAFDVMIYTYVISTLTALWQMPAAYAGYIQTCTILTSAVGGWAAGILADKFGRVRILMLTVAWFSFFTVLSASTNSFWGLLFARSAQGFGFGGEWWVGSVLISEMIQAVFPGGGRKY